MPSPLERKRFILCADIGTSSLKAGLIDIAPEASVRLAAFTREVYVKAAAYGPFSTDSLKQSFRSAINSLARQLPGFSCEALCISANGPTLVAVDRRGETLSLLHWFKPGDRQSGIRSFFLPQLLAFREAEPELFARTARVFSCQEWLAAQLGAPAFTALPSLAYTPFYWDEEQCACAGFDAALFPPFVPMGQIAGRVSAGAAEKFGLVEGTPIIASGPDFLMTLLGSGVVKPGLVCDRTGSSEGINLCVTEEDALKAQTRGESFRILPHVIEGLWNIGIVIAESGVLFDRWREESGKTALPYEELMAELIPNENETGVAPVITRIAEQTAAALSLFSRAGFPIREMRLSGGQSRSTRWNRYKAKCTGTALLKLEIPDAELTGNAALAMAALHKAASPAEAARFLVKITERFEPC